jgi:hypothetical protein
VNVQNQPIQKQLEKIALAKLENIQLIQETKKQSHMKKRVTKIVLIPMDPKVCGVLLMD